MSETETDPTVTDRDREVTEIKQQTNDSEVNEGATT